MSKPKQILIFKILGSDGWIQVKGRDAWALQALIDAGSRGITPIQNPAPRMSAYVHKLRKAGLLIETIHEPHGGPYAGTHGRYVLRTAIVLKDERAMVIGGAL